MTFYKLPIIDIIRETPKAVSIVFNIPENLKEFYQYNAGQYVTIKLTLDGKDIRRSYSMSSAPHENQLKITVKAIENGTFSVFANENLKVGQILEVATPDGKFFYQPNNVAKNYLCIAAGSGITPVFSILKTILENEDESKVVLIYGNKTLEDTIFYQEIINLEKKYSKRFHYHFVFSQNQIENALYGRIEHSILSQIIKNKHQNIDFSSTYICGPENMIKNVSEALIQNGIDKNKIHFELFTSSETKLVNTSNDGNTTITVKLDNDEKTFTMSKKTIVLDAVLNAGIDAPYSCQGGVCSSCLAKITEGSVTMVKNNVLTDSEVASGLILTCQAHATSDILVVDYDDV
ncbi:MAG: 2Fe-2S iron-sulfur cluster-binding protein [Fusobacteriaceae bacterium]